MTLEDHKMFPNSNMIIILLNGSELCRTDKVYPTTYILLNKRNLVIYLYSVFRISISPHFPKWSIMHLKNRKVYM